MRNRELAKIRIARADIKRLLDYAFSMGLEMGYAIDHENRYNEEEKARKEFFEQLKAKYPELF